MACALTPEQILALQGKIADAESAYHRLLTGQSVSVFIDQNGEQVRYSATARADLYAYITSLKAQLPTATCGYRGYPRPMRPYF